MASAPISVFMKVSGGAVKDLGAEKRTNRGLGGGVSFFGDVTLIEWIADLFGGVLYIAIEAVGRTNVNYEPDNNPECSS